MSRTAVENDSTARMIVGTITGFSVPGSYTPHAHPRLVSERKLLAGQRSMAALDEAGRSSHVLLCHFRTR